MEKKKHILFISSWYPNRNDPTFGIFNRYFAEAVSLRNKVSVLNVSSEAGLQSVYEQVETKNGIYTLNIYYRKIVSGLPLLGQITKRKRVLKAFDMGFRHLVESQGKPDLIHLNVAMPMGVGALYLSKKYNIPFVLNENWSGYTKEDGNYRGFLQQFYTRRIVTQARMILPTSEYLKNAMLSHGLAGEYKVVPNTVNAGLFRPGENISRPETRLIHISSLNDREKNVSGLIRAFASALRSQPSMCLRIVGEGVDKAKYEDLVKKLDLSSKVKFMGRLLAGDLVREIDSSDALVMFSNYETFCLVNIEAFACGKPVISSGVGAIPEYLNGDRGMLVEKGNERALAEALVQFSQTKTKYSSAAIRQYAVDHYSYEHVSAELDKAYNFALDTK